MNYNIFFVVGDYLEYSKILKIFLIKKTILKLMPSNVCVRFEELNGLYIPKRQFLSI